MEFLDKQIAPPKSWEKFEDLSRALFAAIWRAPLAQKNGRAGQAQRGVDIYGTPADAPGQTFGVQCKGKTAGYGSKATIAEFDAELARADGFQPSLSHWTFAMSAPNDVLLQEHARLVSERRTSEGRFPVTAIGWGTFQALLASQPPVIREFYPEHAEAFQQIVEALKMLPTVDQLEEVQRTLLAVRSLPAVPPVDVATWSEVHFNTARDIGPALMGRALGPADVAACPEVPEVEILLADLERAGTARLVGTPGAGKSICTLQVAHRLHDQGWKIMRLRDPSATVSMIESSSRPVLHLVDDAHLMRPAILRDLEEQATQRSWILSAHTTFDGKGNRPGTIHLDERRAVKVIAAGLRASRKSTLAAVHRADDRVGDGRFDERLEHRLDEAKKALFPWQFCFILGGGWRRAETLAASACAASADLVLAAAAIQQLSSRDARCSRDALRALLGSLISAEGFDAAFGWLVAQRLFLNFDDLRCPHQRLAVVLLDRILERQDNAGRHAIGCLLQTVLIDREVPLAGIAVLLSELHVGRVGPWSTVLKRDFFDSLLERCWTAKAPLEIRDACWALYAMRRFVPDEMAQIESHREVFAGWIEQAPVGACHAIANVVNHVGNTDKKLATNLVELTAPEQLARAISAAEPLHAAEIAHLIGRMHIDEKHPWRTTYLSHIDREACRRRAATWPQDAYLSAVAGYCEHFRHFDPEFGLDLIETLIPAIANRLCAEPQESFRELDKIVWHSLRMYDPLNIYVGSLAPTRRMRQVAHRICACWAPNALALQLSRSSLRTFDDAAGLLSFMRKAAPKRYAATVRSLDWDAIGHAIGDSWTADTDEVEKLLAQAYQVPEGRKMVGALISRNESRIEVLSTRLAAMAPPTAIRHVSAGKSIRITNGNHVDWELGAFVLGNLVENAPELVDKLLEPHCTNLAAAISQHSPTYYNKALLFLRIFAQVAPHQLSILFDQVDVVGAGVGWRNALRGKHNIRRDGARSNAKQSVSLLIHHALSRSDNIGKLAQQLRRDMPRRSVPSAKTLELIDFS